MRFESTRSPIFSQSAPPPAKQPSPHGSVMGYRHQDGAVVTIDAGDVHRSTTTDGSGFYGFLSLAPGEYHVEGCVVHVFADRVSRLDLPCHN
jgi:hypothetical protein